MSCTFILCQAAVGDDHGILPQPGCEHAREPASIDPILIGLFDRFHGATVDQPSRRMVLGQRPMACIEARFALARARPTLPLDMDGFQRRVPCHDGYPWMIEVHGVPKDASAISR
jgi:hypothetical protein